MFDAFQSTQPEWAATTGQCPRYIHHQNFNPRSPSGLRLCLKNDHAVQKQFQSTQPEWAATRHCSTKGKRTAYFNPRSPSGLRHRQGYSYTTCKGFQSTQPEWAATYGADLVTKQLEIISIHAARVGCDRLLPIHSAAASDFNPRSPSGLRLITTGLIR